ncbi:hypothetical protein V9T40_001400 [Parthenolecanium corni]|uniref:Uncharacterized protein n=1 Tax=Parthenolecanium corni TaxID=536013 RepID=A0AAN9TS84_9HEMI
MPDSVRIFSTYKMRMAKDNGVLFPIRMAYRELAGRPPKSPCETFTPKCHDRDYIISDILFVFINVISCVCRKRNLAQGIKSTETAGSNKSSKCTPLELQT